MWPDTTLDKMCVCNLDGTNEEEGAEKEGEV